MSYKGDSNKNAPLKNFHNFLNIIHSNFLLKKIFHEFFMEKEETNI